VPWLRITLHPVGQSPLPFFAGYLEPGEVTSIIVAALKLLDTQDGGWTIHLESIPDMEGT